MALRVTWMNSFVGYCLFTQAILRGFRVPELKEIMNSLLIQGKCKRKEEIIQMIIDNVQEPCVTCFAKKCSTIVYDAFVDGHCLMFLKF